MKIRFPNGTVATIAVHALALTDEAAEFVLSGECYTDGYYEKGVEHITFDLLCSFDMTRRQLNAFYSKVKDAT